MASGIRLSLALSRVFFFSSRRRHTRCSRDWSSDVCSSDLFGMREALMPGCGATVSRKDASALVEAVSRRLTDPARAEREGIGGRRRVEERYSVGATTASMAEVYCEILAARTATSGCRT